MSRPSRFAATILPLLLLPLALSACGAPPPPAATVVKRRPDAGLLQPCDRSKATVPANPDGRQAGLLWLEAEELLARCANKHDRLVDFELERAPDLPAAVPAANPSTAPAAPAPSTSSLGFDGPDEKPSA